MIKFGDKNLTEIEALADENFSKAVQRYVQMLEKSRSFPSGINKDNAELIIYKGINFGWQPSESISKIQVIQGKIVITAQGMKSIAMKNGVVFEKTEGKDFCTVKGTHPTLGEMEATFTMEEAKKAGLADKDIWKKYASDMLYNRAISRLCRQFVSDIFAGVYVEGELEDDKPEPQKSQAKSEPKAEPKPAEKSAPEPIKQDITQQIKEEVAASKPAEPAEPNLPAGCPVPPTKRVDNVDVLDLQSFFKQAQAHVIKLLSPALTDAQRTEQANEIIKGHITKTYGADASLKNLNDIHKLEVWVWVFKKAAEEISASRKVETSAGFTTGNSLLDELGDLLDKAVALGIGDEAAAITTELDIDQTGEDTPSHIFLQAKERIQKLLDKAASSAA